MRFRNDVLTCTLSTLLAFERRARQSESLNLFQVSLLNTWMWITPIHRDVRSRNSLHSFQLFSAKCFYMFLLKEFRVFVLVARWWGNFFFVFGQNRNTIQLCHQLRSSCIILLIRCFAVCMRGWMNSFWFGLRLLFFYESNYCKLRELSIAFVFIALKRFPKWWIFRTRHEEPVLTNAIVLSRKSI